MKRSTLTGARSRVSCSVARNSVGAAVVFIIICRRVVPAVDVVVETRRTSSGIVVPRCYRLVSPGHPRRVGRQGERLATCVQTLEGSQPILDQRVTADGPTRPRRGIRKTVLARIWAQCCLEGPNDARPIGWDPPAVHILLQDKCVFQEVGVLSLGMVLLPGLQQARHSKNWKKSQKLQLRQSWQSRATEAEGKQEDRLCRRFEIGCPPSIVASFQHVWSHRHEGTQKLPPFVDLQSLKNVNGADLAHLNVVLELLAVIALDMRKEGLFRGKRQVEQQFQ